MEVKIDGRHHLEHSQFFILHRNYELRYRFVSTHH